MRQIFSCLKHILLLTTGANHHLTMNGYTEVLALVVLCLQPWPWLVRKVEAGVVVGWQHDSAERNKAHGAVGTCRRLLMGE